MVNKKKENREILKREKFRVLTGQEAGLGQEGRIQVQKYKAKKKNESYTKYLIKQLILTLPPPWEPTGDPLSLLSITCSKHKN